MKNSIVRINGTGWALADYLYTDINFKGPQFSKFLSIQNGDRGLCPRKLVFTEELEKYVHLPYAEILKEILVN
jgi:hypothetical protein